MANTSRLLFALAVLRPPMQDREVLRLFTLALVVAAGVYFWKHMPSTTPHSPGLGPGLNVVTINPLPSGP